MDIRTLCLGILALGDATGYEIRKMVREGSLALVAEASFGSIYPALAQLAKEGLITCRSEPQEGRPDKKIYAITEAGREALRRVLQQPPEPDRVRSDFLAALLFAEAVAPERIPALLFLRREQLGSQIAALEPLLDDEALTCTQRFVLRYGLNQLKAARAFLEEEGRRLEEELRVSSAAE